MLGPSLSDPDLLKAVLKPLLQDFQFWFRRTKDLLEQEHLVFLEAREQSELLARVRKTQQQVTVAQSLLDATEGEVGLEMAVLTPWHQLVLECWQVTMRFRRQQADQGSLGESSSRLSSLNAMNPTSALGRNPSQGSSPLDTPSNSGSQAA